MPFERPLRGFVYALRKFPGHLCILPQARFEDMHSACVAPSRRGSAQTVSLKVRHRVESRGAVDDLIDDIESVLDIGDCAIYGRKWRDKIVLPRKLYWHLPWSNFGMGKHFSTYLLTLKETLSDRRFKLGHTACRGPCVQHFVLHTILYEIRD